MQRFIWKKKGKPFRSLPFSPIVPIKLLLGGLESSLELDNTSAGVNKLLFAGVEGMALCANVHVEVFLGGSGGVFRTASANDHGILVGGMKSFFHSFHLFLFLFTLR